MNKTKTELVQVVIFAVIVLGQLFLASRYYSREDTIGTTIFGIVALLALIAAIGHFIEWRKARSK